MSRNKTPIVKTLVVSMAVGLMSACFNFAPRPAPPPPPESYVQDPVKNMALRTRIDWRFEYQPADSNAAFVWSSETAPNKMRDDLNSMGQSDGNTFLVSNPGETPNLIIYVHQYCNGQAGENYAASLMAELYGLGHRDIVCRVRTDSFRYESDAVYDLSKRLYSWLHTGWHTNDRN